MAKNSNILENISRGLIAGGALSRINLANKIAGLSLSATTRPSQTKISELEGKRWVLSGITSTNVDTIAYDPNNKELYVRFKGGSIYKYNGVPEVVALTFKSAPSKGKFVWGVLRNGQVRGGKYSYSKVDNFPSWVTKSGLISANPERFFKQSK
jgi:KTSC domain